VQGGENLQASGVLLSSNEIWSTGIAFVDPTLRYAGDHDRYRLVRGDSADEQRATPAFLALHEVGSTLTLSKNDSDRFGNFGLAATNTPGWRLELTAPAGPLNPGAEDNLRGTLVQLRSAALQFGHCGLKVTIGGQTLTTLAQDWSLLSDGISLDPKKNVGKFSLRLISPHGKIVREWNDYPPPTSLGLALRQNVGPPDYSRLPLEEVRARD
jgi:hypothetical protein